MNRRDAIRSAAAAAAGLTAGASPILGQLASAGSPPRRRQEAPELLIRGGQVINHDGRQFVDVRIVGERITELGPALVPTPKARTIEARGHLVMPGGIDPHAHLQGSFVDDLTTGTAAAVAGGITTVGTFAYAADGETPIEAMDRWLAEVPEHGNRRRVLSRVVVAPDA